MKTKVASPQQINTIKVSYEKSHTSTSLLIKSKFIQTEKEKPKLPSRIKPESFCDMLNHETYSINKGIVINHET